MPNSPAPRHLHESNLRCLTRTHQGKVRDIYAIDDRAPADRHDRPAFALRRRAAGPDPGQGPGAHQHFQFWFARTGHIVPNHLADLPLDKRGARSGRARCHGRGRCMVVRRLKALPIEAVVRGYLIGSGWKDYQTTGAVCGITLPPGLRMADDCRSPIFTPATKAAVGDHDENIGFAEIEASIGPAQRCQGARHRDRALRVRRGSCARARHHHCRHQVRVRAGRQPATLTLIDEVLTPDSSRFWPADSYRTGTSPPSFDKQFVRDYLETLRLEQDAARPAPAGRKSSGGRARNTRKPCAGSPPRACPANSPRCSCGSSTGCLICRSRWAAARWSCSRHRCATPTRCCATWGAANSGCAP